MNVFELRDRVIDEYESFVKGFITIKDGRIREKVEKEFKDGLLWPDPIVQLSPAFETGDLIEDLIKERVLHPKCAEIFVDKNGNPLRLYKHQTEAIRRASKGENYVLTTGTGSGKSLTYIIPIVDHVLRVGSGGGVKAIVVYPMNALANSQRKELEKFLSSGENSPVTFKRYTGQESQAEKQAIRDDPPDVILTNYVMLELMLTRWEERGIVEKMGNLRFLVFDELHSYRGRQGADVAMLARRTREASGSESIINVGTSATLASSDSREEQAREVARVASQIFGANVKPENAISESLERATEDRWNFDSDEFKEKALDELQKIEAAGDAFFEEKDTFAKILKVKDNYVALTQSALAAWIEKTFGVRAEPGTGVLVRQTPRSLTGADGAGKELADLLGIDPRESDRVERCENVLRSLFMLGYKTLNLSGRPFFAFRLHQFISEGDSVYATLESNDAREFYTRKQVYAPDGSQDRKLYPLLFCRCCGQEFYCVSKVKDRDDGYRFDPRDPRDASALYEHEAGNNDDIGYLYSNQEKPVPFDDPEKYRQFLPDHWFDPNGKIKSDRRADEPKPYRVSKDGKIVSPNEVGINVAFLRTPFRFCPNCEASYDPSNARKRLKEFGRLGGLATGGRSSATTILALSVVRHIKELDLGDLSAKDQKFARKLLSFSDNRQDASLQAGHLNDFVEVCALRGALYRALLKAGDEGLVFDDLLDRVIEETGLKFEQYALNEDISTGSAYNEVNATFRDTIGHKLFCDLKRGWRVLIPNLEQLGLLKIEYRDLEEIVADDEIWSRRSSALSLAPLPLRREIMTIFLDWARRELAIDYVNLSSKHYKKLLDKARRDLKSRYGFDDSVTINQLWHSVFVAPLAQKDVPSRVDASSVTPRSGFGRYLKRIFAQNGDFINADDIKLVIQDLLETLTKRGILVEYDLNALSSKRQVDGESQVAKGYLIKNSSIIWKLGDGKLDHYDPIRQPNKPIGGEQTNRFFKDFYKTFSLSMGEIEAREHTAQVQYEERKRREDAFRNGDLPILFCSPTMELGVDISQLNVVHMRNIPPTPANYAQRSGRAGRSGQPALVLTYASSRNQHDHYFFNHRYSMVAGSVQPPQIDLTNEDLAQSHVRAIWLSEAVRSNRSFLTGTISKIIDVNEPNGSIDGMPSCDIYRDVLDTLKDGGIRDRALKRIVSVLETIPNSSFDRGWAEKVLDRLPLTFEDACKRWRELYLFACAQQIAQNKLVNQIGISKSDKERYDRARKRAENEKRLLRNEDEVDKSDYYSYRYLASEGFLPGYNFPRLPVVAFLPGGGLDRNRDDYLSRPRFLAIREFGPKAIVYHEGSKFVIDRIDALVTQELGSSDFVGFSSAKICPKCGCYHEPNEQGLFVDLCEFCESELGTPYENLLQLKKVTAARSERIDCDEEERSRAGFDIQAAFRFAQRDSSASYSSIDILTSDDAGKEIAWGKLAYGASATIFQINNGYRNQMPEIQKGFPLDISTGNWFPEKKRAKSNDSRLLPPTIHTRPFVQDTKNCVLLSPNAEVSREIAPSFQAALHRGIQRVFSVEESEISVFPLPDDDHRQRFLFYESSEGGAGVLRRLLEPDSFRDVIREAIMACHFDPDTGNDLKRAENATEDCGGACYDCLLSFSNQHDHDKLNRFDVKDLLFKLLDARIVPEILVADRLDELRKRTESQLERSWLDFLSEEGFNLPDRAQYYIKDANTRPDFVFDKGLAIYVDGPVHDNESNKKKDQEQEAALDDFGWTFVRFRHDQTREEWKKIVERFPSFFITPGK